MSEMARIEQRINQEMQEQFRLSDAILDGFADIRKGSPIAYIMAQAAREATEAHIALSDADPSDSVAIRTLQTDIHRHRDIVRWISRALIEGKAAYDLMKHNERIEMLNEVTDSFDGED